MKRPGVPRTHDSVLQPPIGPDSPPGPCMRYVIDVKHYKATGEIRNIYVPEEVKPPVTVYDEEFNPKTPRKGRDKVKETEIAVNPEPAIQVPPMSIEQLNLTDEIGKVWGNIMEDMKSLRAMYIKRAERDFAEQLKEMMRYVT